MERLTPLVLPEGLIRNTDDIYQEVASYPIVPPEKLWQYWHVYTTTFRRLIDPTASRLENFWWHVMGSDRRYLSGKALAKIYEEISTGPTFLPLRHPPNRHHTQVPRVDQREVDRAGAAAPAQTRTCEREEQVEDPGRPMPETITMKEPMSSSSRPPPPHPILKKSRGPSASGPRPTARFVSPHDSEEEAVKDAGTSSGSTAASRMEMRRPAVPLPTKTEKKLTPTGRKFTASTATSKRRPVIPRRQSSQSSVLSDSSTKGASTASGSRVGLGTRSSSVEQPKPASLASSANSTLADGPRLSAKAAGKRLARVSPDTERNPNRGTVPSAQSRAPPVIVQQQLQAGGYSGSDRQSTLSGEATNHQTPRAKNDVHVSPTAQVGKKSRKQAAAPMMVRSQSNIEHQQHRPRDAALGRPPPQSLITPKSVAVTKKAADVSVQVQFDSDSVTVQGGGIARDIPDSISLASRPSTSSLYTPTQPSPTPDIPLGRSKSQLTLLLERDKDRVGDVQGKSRPGR